MVKLWGAVALLLAFSPYAMAQDSESPIADPQNVAEVLNELDAAGIPATEAEVAEFLAASRRPARGYVLARWGWLAEAGWDASSRMRWSDQRFYVRGKWRRSREGATVSGAVASLVLGKARMAVGQLGIDQGFGLVMAGPGRGPSMTADGRLGAQSRGLILWGGGAEAQTLLGGAAEWVSRRWQWRVVAGQRATNWYEPVNTEPATVATQGVLSGDDWQISALGLTDVAEKSLSLAGHWRRGRADGSWEVAWRRSKKSAVPWQGWLGQVGWRPHASLYLECLMGWSDEGPRPVLGQKHPVLADWSGQGLAVRGTWRLAKGLGLKALLHGGQAGALGLDRRDHKSLFDLQLSKKWPDHWRLEARWRRNATEEEVFSERFPWQPASLFERTSREITSLKAGWEKDRYRLRLTWRRLALAKVNQVVGWESGGSRQLVAFSGGADLGRGGYLRAGWTWSWGDPVDLVSAVVPFAGYVLPRHWGHWRSETHLGIEWPWGPFEGHFAVSRRRPDVPVEESPVSVADLWAGWLELVWHW